MIANPAFYGIDHQTHVYEHEYCIAVSPSDNALTIGQLIAVPVLLNMICTAGLCWYCTEHPGTCHAHTLELLNSHGQRPRPKHET